MTHKTDYTSFLALMAANCIQKKNKDSLENNNEFISIVKVVYRDAVSDVMRDTGLYLFEIPIDIYQDVKRYDLIAPDGYHILKAVEVVTGKLNKLPSISFDKENIRLLSPPPCDINKAFYAKISVSPNRLSGLCEFDTEFVEQNYELIRLRMLELLSEMTNRSWKAKTSGQVLHRRYKKAVQGIRFDSISRGSRIKVKEVRFSNGTR